MNYEQLAVEIIRERGATIALNGDRPRTGFAVSLGGHERTVWPRTTRNLADALYSYVVDHGRALRDPGAHLGAWYADGRVYLDVSHVLKRERDAVAFARANHQRAIFNLTTGQELHV